MSGDLITEITIFLLAVFVGFEVISKVPTMLHTPLMSGTNAIHGIVLLGGLIVVGAENADTLAKIAGTVAVAFGTINIVGGFLVTDRMLEMFKGRGAREKGRRSASGSSGPGQAEKGGRSDSGSAG
jgi:NAD(P) transhydrogenase subunit alpha